MGWELDTSNQSRWGSFRELWTEGAVSEPQKNLQDGVTNHFPTKMILQVGSEPIQNDIIH